MQKQNKNVRDIDERDKGRKGIEEMLSRMSELKRSDYSKNEKVKKKQRKFYRSHIVRAVFLYPKLSTRKRVLFLYSFYGGDL